MLEHHLATLTSRSQETEFEGFARPIFRTLRFFQNCYCAMPLFCASYGYGVYLVWKSIDGGEL
jgi:hypothetical protein